MLLTIDIRDVKITDRDYSEPTKEEVLDHIKEALQEVKLIQEGKLPGQGSLQNLIDELKYANWTESTVYQRRKNPR